MLSYIYFMLMCEAVLIFSFIALLVIACSSQREIDSINLKPKYRDKPIFRLFDYGREMNLFDERMTNAEIEHRIKKRTWNPRWTRPHYPWNKDDPPTGLWNGK